MMTGAENGDIDGDTISAKTLTASTTGSDKTDRNSATGDVPDNESYLPSIFVRIFVSEFNVQKCLQFPPATPIWEVKQKLFATLPKELKDSFNYGLFCPPYNGRAGKFLDDERALQDYPMPGHVGYLELKYKRRVYKMINLDEKILKQLHTKANLRKFIEYVVGGQAEKITKLCTKGLDPNFHDLDNGETPLTLATTLKEPVPVLAALINGGAHLDFRSLDGCTALHRAAQHNNFKALQGLLELGSSANYKDAKGLTPLYYSVTHAKDPNLCELLLHDYALPGAVDSQGWQEIHQACRNGYIRHLEHLIFYGADIDARNASGNTPLHVCAVNNQESCARVLLFRGADKYAKNYANQAAYHVAVIAGAADLSEVIKRHSTKDIVTLREKPTYNPRRRRRSCSPSSTMSRASSVNRLQSRSPSLSNGGPMLASPSPSSRSYLMFSTTGSVSSGGSNCENSQPSEDCSTSGVVTDKSSCSDESTCTPPSMSRLPPSATMDRGSGAAANFHRNSRPHERDDVMLYSRGERMSVYSEQIRGNIVAVTSDTLSVKSVPAMRADSGFSADSRDNSPVGPRKTVAMVGVPRTVTLVRGAQGFGFVLRGSKSGNMCINRELQVVPGDNPPALQYLDEVDRAGPADAAGLRPGDFLLSINGEDVRAYPHDRAVNLIRIAQHSVTITVMSPPGMPMQRCNGTSKSSSSLSKKLMKGGPQPPRRDPRTSLTIGPERSKSFVAGLNDIGAANYDTMSNDSAKIASIRARPVSKRITASEIEELMVRQGGAQQQQQSSQSPNLSSFIPLTKSDNNKSTTVNNGGSASRVFTSVAHMKRQRAAVQQQRRKTDVTGMTVLHKDYHSTPDLTAEGHDHNVPPDDATEDLYSDTVFYPSDIYQNASEFIMTDANTAHVVQPQYHNGFHSVPSTPQNVPGYARPICTSAYNKPPLPPNRPVLNSNPNFREPPREPVQQTTNRAGTLQHHMKTSQSMDERTYSNLASQQQQQQQQNTSSRYTKEPVAKYAAPDDPEPDYFSDEDRISFTSSGRSRSSTSTTMAVAAAARSVPAVVKTPNAGGVPRMMTQPPPPPPPPAAASQGGSSFAAAIAKAAQARRANVDSSSDAARNNPLPPSHQVAPSVQQTSVPTAQAAPKLDGFQSELMRAIQRRSQEKDTGNSTDVDALARKEQNEVAARQLHVSTVKDRITFLERSKVVPGMKSVRLSGITTDQSSTDADDASNNKTGPEMLLLSTTGRVAGVHAGKADTFRNGAVNGTGGGGGLSEIDEGTAARFRVCRSVSGGGGYIRDHDAASINSQSSASTLSSGYESPTLKYGSAGEHLWTHVLETNSVHATKFSPSIDILPELIPVPKAVGFITSSAASSDYDPVLSGSHIAPPPEFS